MTIKVFEFDSEFSFEMTADTMEDAAWITRVGINQTRKITLRSCAWDKGKFQLDATIGKRKNWSSTITKLN